MKKVIYVLTFSLFGLMFFSCTPQTMPDDSSNPQSCCGDDLHIPPPPIGGIGG